MAHEEYHHMDEIVHNLWIGDIHSVGDTDTLKEKNVHSVVSAMRGRVSIHPTFIHHQILLDDEEESDILMHLVPTIAFIQAELEKDRGVLVHCQAGMSRSATIVAAYLMYSQNMDVAGALELIKQARPIVQPNDGFLYQLEVFYAASYKISRKDKTTRMYYLERAVNEILNGEGSANSDMFAKFPRMPGDSGPPTPVPHKRRIRCKMCRQELATREHMLDHGQVGPPTPASAYAASPVTSRRPSFAPTSTTITLSRRGSMAGGAESRRGSAEAHPRPRMGSDARPRRPSGLGPEGSGGVFGRGLADMLSMSALDSDDEDEEEEGEAPAVGPRKQSMSRPSPLGAEGADLGRQLSDSITLMEEGVPEEAVIEEDEPAPPIASPGEYEIKPTMTVADPPAPPTAERKRRASSNQGSRRPSFGFGLGAGFAMSAIHPKSSESPEKTSPPLALSTAGATQAFAAAALRPLGKAAAGDSSQISPTGNGAAAAPRAYASPRDIAAELMANPKLAALRSPGGTPAGLAMSPLSPQQSASLSGGGSKPPPNVPPILADPRCSGYFVEPMKWMEPFLEDGELAGKIVCPNKKCGAKLGNYDWAGVRCGCKEWVTPGFCIARNKVDEVV